MAIYFDCWKLVKITDVEPKKIYFSGWRRYEYQLKPEDLIKHHWDHSCFKDKTEDNSSQILTESHSKVQKKKK
jgi:hypothetical protein